MSKANDAFFSYMHRCYHPVVEEWIGDQEFQFQTEEAWKELVGTYAEGSPDTREFAQAYRQMRQPPEAFAVRRFIVTGDLEVATHIRFLGGDPSQPFVELLGQSAEVRGEAAEAQFLDRIAAEYKAFRPLWVRVPMLMRPEVPDFASPRPAGRRIDQYLLAGELDSLAARSEDSADDSKVDGVNFRRVTDSAPFFADYRNAYKELHRERPEWKRRVPASGADDLLMYATDGVMVVAEDNEGFVGLVAAIPSSVGYLDGWLMVEQVLAGRARGRGLGAELQRALIAELEDSAGVVLLGTIDGENVSSLRTAQRVGREIIAAWEFVDLPGAK